MRTLTLMVGLLVAGTSACAAGEHYFRFTVSGKADLDRLATVVSIDNVVGDTVYAYATDTQWESFWVLGYRAEELPHPGSIYDHLMSDAPLSLTEWDRYPTYQGYLAMMRGYVQTFPAICRLDTFGVSIDGRLLLALKISDSVARSEDEPEFLYTSTMHGDETVGYVLLLRLADYLLNQYGQATAEGQRVTHLVDNLEIWINPLFNPDGTYRLGADTTVNNARRGNANGVDLNRNFPDRIRDTVNTGAGRQTETRAMMDFVRRHNFTLSANFHGGAQVVNYPWDNGAPSGTYSACPDDSWFIRLSRAYATPNPDLMNGGFANGITNGCAWYAVFGGRQDWIYWWHGGREVTVELWSTKNPPGSALPQRWTNNKESFLATMEESLKGIRGIVRDRTTGQPLRARIDVIGVERVPVFTDSVAGDYHRLLLPGVYSIVASAAGYRPDTVSGITVTDSAATRADIHLDPISTTLLPTRNEAPLSATLSQNYPNPFNPRTTVQYGVPYAGRVQLVVCDILGRRVMTVFDRHEEAGWKSAAIDATGLASGVYLYQLHLNGSVAETRRLLILR